MKNLLYFIGTLFIITVFAWNVYCVQTLLATINYNNGLEDGYQLGIQQCGHRGSSSGKDATKA